MFVVLEDFFGGFPESSGERGPMRAVRGKLWRVTASGAKATDQGEVVKTKR